MRRKPCQHLLGDAKPDLPLTLSSAGRYSAKMVTMKDGKKRVRMLYDGTDQHPILARTYKVPNTCPGLLSGTNLPSLTTPDHGCVPRYMLTSRSRPLARRSEPRHR